MPTRSFEFIPLWGIPVLLLYALRRVDCRHCGRVVVERVPWARGKERTCTQFQWFLARWARRLSWKETGEIFGVSWDTVFRSVKMAVCWGVRHRSLEGIESIGIDEVAVRKGHQYLTVVYQIDAGCRRLLWVGEDRTRATLSRFFRLFGIKRTAKLKFICSDMWKAYLTMVSKRARNAVHILDRFHVMRLFGKAIDKVRAEEARSLTRDGYENVLKKSRWLLLKRKDHLKRGQTVRLRELLRYNLNTVKAYLLKEDFQRFWTFTGMDRAAGFLFEWIDRAKRTRIKPMKQVARTLDRHAAQILNWYEASGTISSGAVEGMNTKVKLTMRRAYGFRGKNTVKYALYHNLGHLPEPTFAHKFCG